MREAAPRNPNLSLVEDLDRANRTRWVAGGGAADRVHLVSERSDGGIAHRNRQISENLERDAVGGRERRGTHARAVVTAEDECTIPDGCGCEVRSRDGQLPDDADRAIGADRLHDRDLAGIAAAEHHRAAAETRTGSVVDRGRERAGARDRFRGGIDSQDLADRLLRAVEAAEE